MLRRFRRSKALWTQTSFLPAEHNKAAANKTKKRVATTSCRRVQLTRFSLKREIITGALTRARTRTFSTRRTTLPSGPKINQPPLTAVVRRRSRESQAVIAFYSTWNKARRAFANKKNKKTYTSGPLLSRTIIIIIIMERIRLWVALPRERHKISCLWGRHGLWVDPPLNVPSF